jgi:hypothetical protein
MSQKKIYSETEVSSILKKAVEIQEKDTTTAYASGITLEELQRIARECGIEESALSAALIQPEEETKSSFLNFVETHERVFEGELDFSRTDEVVEALGDVKIQNVQTFGRTMRAQVMSGSIFGTMEITARNGRTKLKFRQTPFVAYFAGLHLPLILSFVSVAALAGKGQLLAGLGLMIAFLVLGLALFSTIANVGKKKARTLVDKLSEQVGNLIAEQQVSNPEAKTTQPESDAAELQQRIGQ